MAGDAHQTHTVQHFGALAGDYDRRWRRYLEWTLGQAVEALSSFTPTRVLDVGCGTGEFERLARQRFSQAFFIGVDVTPQMLAVARRKFQGRSRTAFLLAQANRLPVATGSVNVVACCNMLHHVGDLAALFREWSRVLSAGGGIVLVDWCRDFLNCKLAHYWMRLSKPGYTRMWTVAELRDRMESAGFVVREAKRFFVPPYFGMMRLCAEKRKSSG